MPPIRCAKTILLCRFPPPPPPPPTLPPPPSSIAAAAAALSAAASPLPMAPSHSCGMHDGQRGSPVPSDGRAPAAPGRSGTGRRNCAGGRDPRRGDHAAQHLPALGARAVAQGRPHAVGESPPRRSAREYSGVPFPRTRWVKARRADRPVSTPEYPSPARVNVPKKPVGCSSPFLAAIPHGLRSLTGWCLSGNGLSGNGLSGNGTACAPSLGGA
jgi:hypothetical protein